MLQRNHRWLCLRKRRQRIRSEMKAEYSDASSSAEEEEDDAVLAPSPSPAPAPTLLSPKPTFEPITIHYLNGIDSNGRSLLMHMATHADAKELLSSLFAHALQDSSSMKLNLSTPDHAGESLLFHLVRAKDPTAHCLNACSSMLLRREFTWISASRIGSVKPCCTTVWRHPKSRARCCDASFATPRNEICLSTSTLLTTRSATSSFTVSNVRTRRSFSSAS